MKYLLSLVIMISACGSLPLVEETPLNTDIDQDLKQYVDNFLLSCKFEGLEERCLKNLKRIKLIKLKPHNELEKTQKGTVPAGVCIVNNYFNGSYDGVIYINKEYFESLDSFEYAKRSLIFHEAGHCILAMDHIDDRPHIMNSQHWVTWSELDWQDGVHGFFESARMGETKTIFSLSIDGKCRTIHE